jgi:hypothetical protein
LAETVIPHCGETFEEDIYRIPSTTAEKATQKDNLHLRGRFPQSDYRLLTGTDGRKHLCGKTTQQTRLVGKRPQDMRSIPAAGTGEQDQKTLIKSGTALEHL